MGRPFQRIVVLVGLTAAVAAATASARFAQGAAGGTRSDAPPRNAQPGKPVLQSIESRVIAVVARRFKVDRKEITRRTSFADDLKAQPADRAKLKAELEKEFGIRVAPAAFKDFKTVGQAVDHVERAVKTQATARGRPENAVGKGRGDKAAKSAGGFFGKRQRE